MPPVEKPFKKLVLPKTGGRARVHIYGFSHGIGGLESGPSERVAGALQKEAEEFSPADYAVVEGFHEDHLRAYLPDVSEEELAEQRQVDHIDRVIEQHLPGVLAKAERAEHVFPLLDSIIDPRIGFRKAESNAIAEAARAHPPDLERARDQTTLSPKEVDRLKRDLTATLRQRFPDASDEEINLFVEGNTSFRSLLIARTAFHRAAALNGIVRVFSGFQHAEEIKRFIESPTFLNQYLRKLPPSLRELYDAVEHAHAAITQVFKTHSKQVAREHHSAFLKWVAHNAQSHAIEQLRERTRKPFSINLADFKPEAAE